MSYQISEVVELDELREMAELFAAIWERPGEQPINSDILRALSHSGNYIAGTRSENRLIGGIVGWLGGHPPDELHVHSHILGVLPGIEAKGLGFALKQHQRTWCLERGVKAVEWTFDPLVRRNAYFNLTKLGAEAASYLVDFYGVMYDGINAGEESDRILMRWELDSPKAVAAALGNGESPDADRLAREGATRALSVGPGDEPVSGPLEGAIAICQMPADIVAMRRAQPELGRRWRRAVRDSLGAALDQGYAITGATRDGWYVLQRKPR